VRSRVRSRDDAAVAVTRYATMAPSSYWLLHQPITTRRERALLLSSSLLLLAAAAAAAAPPPPLSPQQRRASAHSGTWGAGKPPLHVPSTKSVDGPLLGNGDVGVVAGVHDGTQLVFYLSKSDLWYLEPMRSGPKTLGGVHIGLLAPSFSSSPVPPPHVQFELRQEIGQGVIEWNITLASHGPPSSAPAPRYSSRQSGLQARRRAAEAVLGQQQELLRPVPNCSILGLWESTGLEHPQPSSRVLNFTIRPWGGAAPGAFIWNNTSPTVSHDGWRYATGTVTEATGAIELDYHRFRPVPGIAKFHGAFTGDCQHVTIEKAGTWWRPGCSPIAPLPPSPPPHPTPPPPPPPAQRVGAVLAQGRTTISQTDGLSSVVTTIESSTTQRLSITTWAAGSATVGQTSSGRIVWAARGIGGCSNATAAIATAVLSGRGAGSSAATPAGGGGFMQEVTAAPGTSAVLTHTVVSSLDLGKRTGACSWDWQDPVPVAVAAAAKMNTLKATAIEQSTTQFWARYWNTSLSLPTQLDVERYWYAAQYILGSSSRAGRATNGIWGIWVTTDKSGECDHRLDDHRL
jgi:hypothetical protein